MYILAKSVTKSHILSVWIFCLSPNRTYFSSKVKLCAWEHVWLNKSLNFSQKVCTLWHSQNRWCMVSLWRLQNWQRWHCWLLYFETDLLVVNILWLILNCNQINLLSFVVILRFLNILFQSSFKIVTFLFHLRKADASCFFSIMISFFIN